MKGRLGVQGWLAWARRHCTGGGCRRSMMAHARMEGRHRDCAVLGGLVNAYYCCLAGLHVRR
jgi:hypothetical protein